MSVPAPSSPPPSSSSGSRASHSEDNSMVVVPSRVLFTTSLGNVVHAEEGEGGEGHSGGRKQRYRRKGYTITEEDLDGNVVRVTRAPPARKRRRSNTGKEEETTMVWTAREGAEETTGAEPSHLHGQCELGDEGQGGDRGACLRQLHPEEGRFQQQEGLHVLAWSFHNPQRTQQPGVQVPL
ncbi:hypothetical protein Naga_101581g1, partial [Nannochloropsis gaditana]